MTEATIKMSKKVTIIASGKTFGEIYDMNYSKFEKENVDFEEITLSVATNRNTNSKINKFLERGYEIVDNMVDWCDEYYTWRKLKRI